MIISIVLDTEYMGVEERNKWFLKSVSNATKEDMLIITHSYFKDHINEVVEGCAERFYEEFEMNHVPVEEIKKLDICYISDEMLDVVYDNCGCKTKQILFLFNNRVKEMEDCMISFIDKALERRSITKPDYIMNCLHTFASIKYLAEHYGCPLIPYVFSAIRRVHGYTQTLYMAHIGKDLFNSNACEELYSTCNKNDIGFPLLKKSEILALLGKKHNIPLIPVMEREGVYDVGIVGEGFHITPEIYQGDAVTDDDLYFECKRFNGFKNIITRQHPMQLDKAGIGRNHMKNDPVAFLLSCNHVVTVQSQMIMKAAMWNRAAVAMSNALPYAYLLNRRLIGAKPINDFDLNFILFIYFVPDTCMFNSDYWKWRMSKPTVAEIAKKHMETILSGLCIPLDILEIRENRIQKILQYRGYSDKQIDELFHPNSIFDVPYDYPTSYFKCRKDDGSIVSLFSLNHKNDEYINTSVELPEKCVKCEFIPQNDLDGYITLETLTINGKSVLINNSEKYYSKNQPVVSIILEGSTSFKFNAKFTIKPYIT